MNNPDDYSDEFLNAYIDGELDKDETGRLLNELRYNKPLSTRITDLQKVREMVRYAYNEKVSPTHKNSTHPTRWNKPKMAFAASILLSLGIALGWSLHLLDQGNRGLLEIAEAIQLKPIAANTSDEIKIVLHVTTDKPHKLDTILKEAEKFLSQNNHSKKVKMDILTNGKGIKLLQAKHSPYSQRIKDLQKRYKNLTFKACQQALQRAQKRRGNNSKIELLPDTVTVPSALGELMKKQRDGWSYIKI